MLKAGKLKIAQDCPIRIKPDKMLMVKCKIVRISPRQDGLWSRLVSATFNFALKYFHLDFFVEHLLETGDPAHVELAGVIRTLDTVHMSRYFHHWTDCKYCRLQEPRPLGWASINVGIIFLDNILHPQTRNHLRTRTWSSGRGRWRSSLDLLSNNWSSCCDLRCVRSSMVKGSCC